MLDIPHTVDPSPVEEVREPGEPPMVFAQRMARAKAMDRALHHPGRWVLGADTVVVIEDKMLGKPHSASEAERMLKLLSGRRHQVVSAAALVKDNMVHDGCDTSHVWFRDLDDEAIQSYVSTGEPLDKAGAYGIQGKGAVLIERIEGDFFGVMGLSLRVLTDLLKEAERPYRFTR